MNSKEIFDFTQFIKKIENRTFEKFYNVMRIPLGAAFENKEFNYAGGYFYCAGVSALGLGVTVGFNYATIEKLPVELKRGYQTPFTKFYIKNPTGVAGAYVDLHVGLYAPEFFNVIDNSDDPQTLGLLQDIKGYVKAPYVNLQGQGSGYTAQTKTAVGTSAVLVSASISNANIAERIITALDGNTDFIYVGKDNTVAVANNFMFKLDAGDSFILSSLHKTTLYAISGTAAQNINVAQTSITTAAY